MLSFNSITSTMKNISVRKFFWGNAASLKKMDQASFNGKYTISFSKKSRGQDQDTIRSLA